MDIQPKTTLSFDCYGTLIDWETGIWDGFQKLFMANGKALPRADCLVAFAEIESTVQADSPSKLYPDVLSLTHRLFAQRFELATTPELDARFGAYVPYWPAFPDSAEALNRLKERFNLVILSNVDRQSFSGSNDRLGVTFDHVFTAEDIGSYKPALRNFQHMMEHLGKNSTEILHVAQSLFHDIQPAIKIGLETAWIDRQKLAGGGNWGATAKVNDPPMDGLSFPSMQAFTEFACTNRPAT